MTAGNDTHVMLAPFYQSVPAPRFLRSFFKIPQGGIHNQKTVQVDKEALREDVSVPVDNIASAYRDNVSIARVEMEVEPPVYKEKETISVVDLYDRATGRNPYENNDFQVNGANRALKVASALLAKVDRSIEQQASQILTTGALTLVDATAGAVYTLNYNMDASLFPNSGVAWSTTATTDPIDDLYSLCTAIRDGGGNDAVAVIMDGESFEAAMLVPSFVTRFTAVNANVGALNTPTAPGTRMGSFRGRLQVGDFLLDVWTYGASYINALGARVKYLTRARAVVLTEGRLDATFGGIPRFPGEELALRYLPSRIQRNGLDMGFNSWFSEDRTALNIALGTRPLLIPTDKWAFGCLNTQLV